MVLVQQDFLKDCFVFLHHSTKSMASSIWMNFTSKKEKKFKIASLLSLSICYGINIRLEAERYSLTSRNTSIILKRESRKYGQNLVV